MSRKIRVMVVDDSAVVRQVVTQTLSRDPGIEVIGSALDPVFALEKMKANWPDVIVLDLEMPRMDGLTFLRRIMAERPTPVVICSSLAEQGAQVALDALAAGAVSLITKPKIGLKAFLDNAANDIIQAVKAAAKSRPSSGGISSRPRPATPMLQPTPSLSADVILPAGPASLGRTTDRLVAIGTSTGGTQALEAVLTALPTDCPGLVVVQHMPEKFTAMFAQRLNGLCQIEVREARSGDRVLPGLALIAPGGRHMMVKRNGAQYVVDVVDGPLVNRHKPSVDVLFRSVAKCAGGNALGIIMTGMGDDGARGLKEMRDAGAHTLAEDESSCVVFGMPKEAIRLGGAAEVLPLARMAEGIGRFSRS
jgi:two-component system chemotaxis response regulator CheB